MLELCNHISAYFAFCQPVKSVSPSLASLFFFALRGAGVLFGYCFCVVNSEFPPSSSPPPATDRSWREKYVFALGQSPEGFALMKTDP